MRYRTELLAQLGESSFKPLVKSLKILQDELGSWHDRLILLQVVAEFIGRPNFLVKHPHLGRVLLTEMEKERHRNNSAVPEILKRAEKIREWRSRAVLAE